MTAVLSDNLLFYDNPDEVKPCEWCSKPIVRRESGISRNKFRKRKTCSKSCAKKLQAEVRPGQQWGNLTVLSEGEVHKQPSGSVVNTWVCQCVCTARVTVKTSNLKKRKVISCGCGGRVVPNQQFGMLRAIRKGRPFKEGEGEKNRTAWQCVCECGIYVTVRARDLLDGSTTSCGCKTTSRLEEAVEQSLNRLNVYYKREYKPEPLTKRGFHYRLDFYLPDYNLNIEADGKDFHGGGNQHRSPEEQIEHDDNRNRRVSWFFGCYILRLSEDLLDGNPKHLDAKLRRFLDDMGEKPQYWLTYDFQTPC